jgi:hypothetical protein
LELIDYFDHLCKCWNCKNNISVQLQLTEFFGGGIKEQRYVIQKKILNEKIELLFNMGVEEDNTFALQTIMENRILILIRFIEIIIISRIAELLIDIKNSINVEGFLKFQW